MLKDGNWDEGQELHLEIAKDVHERDQFLGNALIDMYAKCGSLTLARDVVEDLLSQGVISWNTLMLNMGQLKTPYVCELLEQMEMMAFPLEVVTYIRVLNACGTLLLICTSNVV